MLGDVDPSEAYAEYQRQLIEFGSRDQMTGLALLWIEADAAADLALTEGCAALAPGVKQKDLG